MDDFTPKSTNIDNHENWWREAYWERGCAFARRRWLWSFVALGLAFFLATTYSNLSTEYTWKAKGTVKYTPLPVPYAQRGLYASPSIHDVVHWVRGPAILSRVKQELGLGIPTARLREFLRVNRAQDTQTIELTMQWGSPHGARDILQHVMLVLADEVQRIRQADLKPHTKEAQASLDEIETKFAQIQQERTQLCASLGITELERDLDFLRKELGQLEASVRDAQHNLESGTATTKAMTQRLNDTIQEEQAKIKQNASLANADEALADKARRLRRLREKVGELREGKRIHSQLKVLQAELGRKRKLLEENLIPRAQVMELEGRIEALQGSIATTPEIAGLVDEINNLDSQIIPVKRSDVMLESPKLTAILNALLQAEIQVQSSERVLRSLGEMTSKKELQIERIRAARPRYLQLTRELDALKVDRQAVSARLSTLRDLQSLGTAEVAQLTPATPGRRAASSTRKQEFATAMVVCGLAFMAFVVGWDLSRFGLISLTERLSANGFAPLGVVLNRDDDGPLFTSKHADIRSVVLKLRQYVQDPGKILLFTSLARARSLGKVMAQLAACLSQRHERILIIDARYELTKQQHELSGILSGPDEGPGLAEYLVGDAELKEIIRSSSIEQVDYVTPGCTDVGEALASPRMTDLAEVARSYTLTLLLAPPPAYAVDLAILAAHVDEISIVFEEKSRFTKGTRSVLDDLKKAQASFLGSICLDHQGIGSTEVCFRRPTKESQGDEQVTS